MGIGVRYAAAAVIAAALALGGCSAGAPAAGSAESGKNAKPSDPAQVISVRLTLDPTDKQHIPDIPCRFAESVMQTIASNLPPSP
jgi:hypothetical protein